MRRMGRTIRAAAPGKVVLWGEYAVLAGAPALVMAVDRYARCELETDGDGWHFSALGHAAPEETRRRDELLAAEPPARDAISLIAWQALRVLDDARLPAGGAVRLDTRGFQDQGRKLGLGSSAALCVAVYAAFSHLLGEVPAYAEAQRVHQAFQDGAGSGIDVAAAWHGGTLRYQRPAAGAVSAGAAQPWPLPAGVQLAFIYSGAPASTPRHLERLQRWQATGGGRELEALATASEALFESGDLMASLVRYVHVLMALDEAADLGIFSTAHRHLARLAFDAGVVYKPCGAGGGDMGAAFTPDAAAAQRFVRLAADNGYLPLALETAPHGIEVTG